jgi:hypothetical protein
MRKLKIVLLIMSFMVCLSVVSHANEIKISNAGDNSFMTTLKQTDLKSFTPISQKVTNYAASNESRARGFRGMGTAGAVVFGLSWLFTISGSVLMILYWLTYSGYFTSLLTMSTMSIYTVFGSMWFLYVGAALFSIGMLMFWIGLPLMIVGFAVAAHYENKASLIIDTDETSPAIRTALSIKIM